MNNTSTDTKFKNVREYSLKANTGEEIFPYTYMLPQTLVANQQKIDFVFDVKTYRKAPGESEFTLTMTQYNLPASASLISSDIPAWKMNHAITYTINIGPASNPITFDPAICDWAYENVSTNVELDI